MAYSEFEQITLDLNLFLKDKSKIIHIASGGGKLPYSLIEEDERNERFETEFEEISFSSKIEINPQLLKILNLKEEELEDYLEDFIRYARKGFYTYDKTHLDEFDDMTFHLVAKPLETQNLFFDIYTIKNELPTTYEPFTLTKYIK